MGRQKTRSKEWEVKLPKEVEGKDNGPKERRQRPERGEGNSFILQYLMGASPVCLKCNKEIQSICHSTLHLWKHMHIQAIQ